MFLGNELFIPKWWRYPCLWAQLLLLLALSLIGCTGAISDQSESGDKMAASQQPLPTATSIPRPPSASTPDIPGDQEQPSEGDGTATGPGNGTQNPPGTTPPVIEILNLRGGEFLQAGKTFIIYFTVTNQVQSPTNGNIAMSKVEFQFPEEDENTWHLINDKIVSVDGLIAQTTWNICAPNNTTAACSKYKEGLGYRVRISTIGAEQLTNTYITDVFAVDGTKPKLDNSSFSITNVSTAASRKTPFIAFQTSGIEDDVSSVESICITTTKTPPGLLDPCWYKVGALGVTEAKVLPPVSIFEYQGFQTLPSQTYYLWGKDLAGNISDVNEVAGKGRVTFTYSAPTPATIGGYWSDDANPNLGLSFNTSTNSISLKNPWAHLTAFNNLQTMTDPGSIVVSSRGIIYLKDKTAGIIALNPLTEERKVLIPLKATLTEGLLSAAETGVKAPLRIGLDIDDGLWILDESHLAYVDLSQTNPTLKIVAGGGSDESDELSDPKQLKITYHDNTRWYGTFSILPNKTIIFHGENPYKPLEMASGLPHRLRVFNFRKKNITSLYLTGSFDFNDETIAASSLYPLSPLVFTYDFSQQTIKNIYGRFCKEIDTTCSLYMLKLNYKGVIEGQIAAPQNLLYNNFSLISRNSVTVYAFNGFKANLSEYDSANNLWTKFLGYIQRATTFCNNGTSATSCNVRLTDVFVQKNGTMFFLDQNQVRVIDRTSGTIQTLYSPTAGP